MASGGERQLLLSDDDDDASPPTATAKQLSHEIGDESTTDASHTLDTSSPASRPQSLNHDPLSSPPASATLPPGTAAEAGIALSAQTFPVSRTDQPLLPNDIRLHAKTLRRLSMRRTAAPYMAIQQPDDDAIAAEEEAAELQRVQHIKVCVMAEPDRYPPIVELNQ